jgi:predicted nucleic acid-binding protein
MDALVMQTAREYETELVTFDDEMLRNYRTA